MQVCGHFLTNTLIDKYSIKMGSSFSSQLNLEEHVCRSCRRRSIPVVATIGHSVCLEALIKAGTLTDKCSRQSVYQEALEWAAHRGQIECVKILIEAGANVNKKHNTRFRHSAVEGAAYNGNEACLKLLIEGGADVNKKYDTRFRYSAVEGAAYNGNEACLKLLIIAGADVNRVTTTGHTILMNTVAVTQSVFHYLLKLELM